MATKEAILALFEQRFDYYSARTVMGEALARAGLADRKDYDAEQLDRLVQGLVLTGHGMLDRLIAGLKSLDEQKVRPVSTQQPETVEAVAGVQEPEAEAPAPADQGGPDSPDEAPAAVEEPEAEARPKSKKKR